MNFVTHEPPFRFRAGSRPLLISMPHVGTYLPPCVAERLTDTARLMQDTDWHLERLYEFADECGASVLIATHSRYVIDLNRPPDGSSLYPGQSVTGLCPIDGFDSLPLYQSIQAQPDAQEVLARKELVWAPYHAQLQSELARIRQLYGRAVLWDAHSIRSEVPRFFEGRLPDLNLGTADGASCAPELADKLLQIGRDASGYTAVLNGRFKGGHITRHYGAPTEGVHAIQLEMAQSTYMNETHPFEYRPDLASGIAPHIHRMLKAALDFVESPKA